MLESLLQSDWLIRMLDKADLRPANRLLALFEILDDVLSSPLTAQGLSVANTPPPAQLQQYLVRQAQQTKAKMPDMLANQLYFMAQSACQDKLLHPESKALLHAQLAARALIDAQTKLEVNWLVIRNYGIALSCILISIAGGYALHGLQAPMPAQITATTLANLSQPLEKPLSNEASPSETAAIYSRLETMKHGDCRFIEALQLPEKLKSIYIENIINGHVSTNREEQILVNQLLDQVNCNYTPQLMMHSK